MDLVLGDLPMTPGTQWNMSYVISDLMDTSKKQQIQVSSWTKVIIQKLCWSILEISDRVIEKLKSRRVLSVVFCVWDRWWVNGGISNYTSVYLRERHKPVYRDTTGISIYIIIYILGCIESTIVENCEVVRNVMDNFDSFGFTTKLKKMFFLHLKL